MIADPENGKPNPADPEIQDAVNAYEAELAVRAYDAVTGTFAAYDAVKAYEAEFATNAYDEVAGTFKA